MTKYLITGTLRNGRRFKPIRTSNPIQAMGINLWRGSVWKVENEKRVLLKRVWN